MLPDPANVGVIGGLGLFSQGQSLAEVGLGCSKLTVSGLDLGQDVKAVSNSGGRRRVALSAPGWPALAASRARNSAFLVASTLQVKPGEAT